MRNAAECEEVFTKVTLQIMRDFNVYALDYPVCTDDARRAGRNQRNQFMRHTAAAFNLKEETKQAIGLEPVEGYQVGTAVWAVLYGVYIFF